jgi:hypothetical protein
MRSGKGGVRTRGSYELNARDTVSSRGAERALPGDTTAAHP